ncbi:Uncharacterised protein [Mycobacteroides abscessus subsp. abscessus]|uniref:Uncharacterized protein n=1 Tax=Mycobacteroides abscessus TaxID=36809 RepID=A0AB33T1G2_9MYCO|nr:hypothetical protein [Mycobacteroides abscessus]MDO3015305.1 hypothetical protein [Mycobacteroides abscessus subsp. abscessus]MDO3085858.1 hypothetical protein [Mycobacteroides abscessus subsp. abscessus]MDO3315771.1 hypothetical protein [Mycobacteroides abscessus subsp. abscessus]MDO3343048.1 hypothetical protein [Mycobacteroides abscessus subsp. abscessus]PVB17166.1 hypothetical protein DDJ68_01730 [Mycobacteroides abscessus]
MTDEIKIVPREFELGIDLDSSENICMRLGVWPHNGGPQTSIRLEVEDARNIATAMLGHVSAIEAMRTRFAGRWSELAAQVESSELLEG